MKKSNVFVAALCTIALVGTSFYVSNAGDASSGTEATYNSKGKIVYDVTDGSEDIVFDATDFLTIDRAVVQGKNNVLSTINTYVVESGNAAYTAPSGTVVTFDKLSELINSDIFKAGIVKNLQDTGKDDILSDNLTPATVSKTTLRAGETSTVTSGYLKDDVTITAASLASQTGVDAGKQAAAAAQIRKDYQAWVLGAKITGTMPDYAGKNQRVTTGISEVTDSTDSTAKSAQIKIPAAGYYDKNSTIEVPIETIKNEVTSLNSSLIVDALKKDVTGKFDSLNESSTCQEIATSITNSGLILSEETLDSGWFSVTGNMSKTLTSTTLKEILYVKSATSSNTSISWGNGNVFSISGNRITTSLRPAATTVDNYNMTITVVGIPK